MKFITVPLWTGKTHSEGIETFDIGVQWVQCSAKRLALHLAECFPWTVGRSFESVAVKKIGIELRNDDHKNICGLRGEFDFISQSAKSQRRYLLIRLE